MSTVYMRTQWSANTEVQVYKFILPITRGLLKGIFGVHLDERQYDMDESCVRVGQKFTPTNFRNLAVVSDHLS